MKGVIFVLFFLLLFSTTLHAEKATISIGVNIAQQTLQAQKADDPSDRNIGEMETDLSFKPVLSPVLSFKTKNLYFGETRWGGFVEMMAFTFDIDKQVVNGKRVDLGTSVSGYYAYLTPVICYTFGDRYSEKQKDWKVTLGIGGGYGYLNVTGGMIMTEMPDNPRADVSGSGSGFSVGIIFEVEKSMWFSRITNFAPVVEINDYELMLHNVKIIFGRKFALPSFLQF